MSRWVARVVVVLSMYVGMAAGMVVVSMYMELTEPQQLTVEDFEEITPEEAEVILSAVAEAPLPIVPPVHPIEPCLSRALADTLVELAALPRVTTEPITWVYSDLTEWAGLAWPDRRTVALDDDLPCWAARSVVLHEWMHVRTAEVYGTDLAAEAALGADEYLEAVADCGAILMGAVYHPYADVARGCTAAQLAEATDIINGVAGGSHRPEGVK